MNTTFTLQPICRVAKPSCPSLFRVETDGMPTVRDVVADILNDNTNYGYIKVYSENRDLYVSSMQYNKDRLFDIVNPVYDDEIVTGGRAIVRGKDNMDYALYVK